MKFEFKNGLIFIRTLVKGTSIKRHLPFSIIDTGSSVTVIRTSILDELGYSARNGTRTILPEAFNGTTKEGYLIKINSLTIGDIEAKDLLVAAIDLSEYRKETPNIDCIIGNNFLRHFKLTIDYKKEELFLKDNQ